jgi:hypothetical protein
MGRPKKNRPLKDDSDEWIDISDLPPSPGPEFRQKTPPKEEKQEEVRPEPTVVLDPLPPPIENPLAQEFPVENNIRTVISEMHSKENISTKTELSHNEVNYITKLAFLEAFLGAGNLNFLTQQFKEHRVSLDRQGRAESVEALQAINRAKQAKESGLGKFFGGPGPGAGGF